MSKKGKTILHIDLDCFFVSVERVLNPALNSKPVIVSGKPDSRGVVSSASYEARAFGVKNGMPLTKALKLCPDAIVLPINKTAYAHFSEQVFNLLRRFSPFVEEASIDEAYIDLTGMVERYGSARKAGEIIQREIKTRLALPCSVGIGSNKLIAKIASKLAKPEGIVEVAFGAEKEFIAELPINILPGVGGKTEERLRLLGAKKVKHIVSLGQDLLITHFGKLGIYIYRSALGKGESKLNIEGEPPKSLSKEITFDQDIFDPEEKEQWIYLLILKLGMKLREWGLYAQRLTLKFRSPDFTTWTRTTRLKSATNNDQTLFFYARKILQREDKPNQPLRLLGVSAGELCSTCQLDLFESEKWEKQNKLLKALDELRKDFGLDIIYPARIRKLMEKINKGEAK